MHKQILAHTVQHRHNPYGRKTREEKRLPTPSRRTSNRASSRHRQSYHDDLRKRLETKRPIEALNIADLLS